MLGYDLVIFRSKKGKPLSKQQKTEQTVAQAVVKDHLNPLHCHHFSNEHAIPVADERTYLEKIKTKGEKARKKRERHVDMGWTSGSSCNKGRRETADGRRATSPSWGGRNSGASRRTPKPGEGGGTMRKSNGEVARKGG